MDEYNMELLRKVSKMNLKETCDYLSDVEKEDAVDLKKVWEFPLLRRGHKVYDANDLQVFDFCGFWGNNDQWKIDKASKDRLVAILNGTGTVENKQVLTYKNGEVFMELKGVVKKLLVMRGWGYMISEVGLNLSADEATKVQDEFAQLIVESVK